MKKYKVPLIISLIACTMIMIVVLLLGTWEIAWLNPPVPEEIIAIPDREIGPDEDMKENIFKQMSENPQELRDSVIAINENGQKTYAWQAIEDLLHKEAGDMEITDYVALLQAIEEMIIQNNDEVITDIEAIRQLIQKGYQGAYLTSTMANLCILYKEWVENHVLVTPEASVLFSSRETEEQKANGEHIKQQMFTAAMLDGILMNDNELVQSKSPSQPTPEISIVYKEREGYIMWHYLIQIGDKSVRIYPYNYNPKGFIRGEIANIEFLPWDETKKSNKTREYGTLSILTDAYDMGATMSVTEDGNLQIVACINETELELRAHSYGYSMHKETKDPKYLNITAKDIKELYYSDPTQRNEYITWWNSDGVQDTWNYKDELTEVANKDPKLSDRRIERLTPNQIRLESQEFFSPSIRKA